MAKCKWCQREYTWGDRMNDYCCNRCQYEANPPRQSGGGNSGGGSSGGWGFWKTLKWIIILFVVFVILGLLGVWD